MDELRTFATNPRPGEILRPRSCPGCGSIGGSRSWIAQGVRFIQCPSCGLWRQDPQPAQDDITARYDERYLEYETEHHLEYRSIALKSLAEAGLYPDHFPVLSDDSGPAAILEIGCATGALLSVFKDAGWRTKGVEVGASLAAYGRSQFGLDIFEGTMEMADLADASFDIVMALHLIEHLNEPRSFLREAFRVLKPDGDLLLITPNVRSFQALLRGAAWRSAIRDHLYLFSSRTLATMLKCEGFTTGYLGTWGGWPAGMRPGILKRPLDALAKRLGWGDVMVLRAAKSGLGAAGISSSTG